MRILSLWSMFMLKIGRWCRLCSVADCDTPPPLGFFLHPPPSPLCVLASKMHQFLRSNIFCSQRKKVTCSIISRWTFDPSFKARGKNSGACEEDAAGLPLFVFQDEEQIVPDRTWTGSETVLFDLEKPRRCLLHVQNQNQNWSPSGSAGSLDQGFPWELCADAGADL